MPRRNTVRNSQENTFYHVYNRAINRALFKDGQDYNYFLKLIKQLMGESQDVGSPSKKQPNLSSQLELNAYCLMKSHFHFLFYQVSTEGIELFMRSLMIRYTVYYNKKYKHEGTLFPGKYRAKMITEDSYLYHILRYILLNPTEWKTWNYSSLGNYTEGKQDNWLKTKRITELYSGKEQLTTFLQDYEVYRFEKDTLQQ
jgi:putative transposase